MSRLIKVVLLIALIALLTVSPTFLAIAQSVWQVRVGSISTIEKPDGMNMKLYFNVVEGQTSAPILDLKAQSAQVQLLNSDFIADAEVKKPDVPIYVVMVLDASGSMGGTAAKLQDAAKAALNNVPDNSLFSIVQFNESIKLLQDFTQNVPAVSYAIDQYKVETGKGTCLYDAAYSAVEALEKAPPGRRAIILFTDGKDELPNGKPCSKHTYQELIDLAMKSQVPINTIGLSLKEAALNEVELASMAASTGGFSAVASKDDLTASFQNIMDALKSQWMVEATIYPRRGTNDAVVTIKLQDDKTLTATFQVNSNTDYPGPPSPVSVELAGLQLNAAKQSYEVQLNMTAPEKASYVKIAVWDTQAGSKVGEYVFNDLAANNIFLIPAEPFTIERSYEMRITVINKSDGTPFAIVRNDNGDPSTELIHPFNFDPSSAYPSLKIQSLVQQKGDLLVTVTLTNPDIIGGFDGWLVDENTNTQVPNSNFTSATLTSANGTLTIPTYSKKIPDGKYTLVIRVLAKNNNVYSTATYEGIAYKAPSIFQRLGGALIATPLILGAILVIVLGVVGFLMFLSMRQKAMSGTPALQGQLGGGLKGSGSSASPVIPVADNEPIPQRGRVASPPAAVVPKPIPPSIPQSSAPAPTNNNATMIAGAPPLYDGATMIAAAPVILPKASVTVLRAPADTALQGRNFPVDQFPFIIGRSEGTLNLLEPNVSRKHVQIVRSTSGRDFFLTDLNSSNGVLINGEKIPAGQAIQLQNGLEVGLGPNITLRFEVS